jgi:hypothetical protein
MDARSHCFACRIMTAVGWMKPDAPRREDRKEKPLLAWGRGRSPEKEWSLRTKLENRIIKLSLRTELENRIIKLNFEEVWSDVTSLQTMRQQCLSALFQQRLTALSI